MGDKSAEGSKPIMEKQVSRRNLLRRGVEGLAAAAAVGALAQVGIKGAEAGGGESVESQSFPLPRPLIEKHPELEGKTARPLEIEGSPVRGNVAYGPEIYKIKAQNGVRLQALIKQDNGAPNEKDHGFATSKLYAANGSQVTQPDSGTFLEKAVFETGDYYLIVDKDPEYPTSNYGYSIEAMNRYDHGINMTFLRDPMRPWATELRFEPEIVPIIRDKNMGVVMTVHLDSPLFNTTDWSEIVKVYAEPGTADDLYRPHRNNDYDESKLLKNCVVNPERVLGENGETKSVRLVITSNQPDGEPGFPDGNLITVAIKGWGANYFATTPPRETPVAPVNPPVVGSE